MLVSFGVLAAGGAAAAADEPSRLPEEVAEYFSSGLLPRLIDLYGPGASGESGIDFAEATTTIGPVTRVMVWTADFRAGNDTDLAAELSNTWVAPISSGEVADEEATDAAEGSEAASEVVQLGLATVWISPYTNLPELANFVPSSVLGPALAEAPEGSMLIHDAEQDAWYALAGDQLTLLAQGGDAIAATPLALGDAQQTLWQELETLPQPRANNGFVIAGLTLAFVVVLLAIFVLVPDRRHTALDPEVALGFGPSSDSPRL
ncbi:MAG TPA: hypothetical protein VFT01_09825 [Homoserinimonas sp.]|nr:hypothetical protein [Homoserinimonas sp.]